jgi:hypothetical protein
LQGELGICDSRSSRFFRPHDAFGVEFSDALLAKTHFLEYLSCVLAQQRSRPSRYNLGIAKAYVVPGQPLPSDHRMLVHDNHVIGRSVWVVEEKLAVSFYCRRAWDTGLLQARQTLCQAQASKALRQGRRWWGINRVACGCG